MQKCDVISDIREKLIFLVVKFNTILHTTKHVKTFIVHEITCSCTLGVQKYCAYPPQFHHGGCVPAEDDAQIKSCRSGDASTCRD